jgi:polygalacturonase
MAHFKTSIFKYLVAICVFTALPVLAAGAADKVIDVTTTGVIGDGSTLNTASIQKAIDDCAAAGGGTILFPPGRYVTGTIQIRSNITLRLGKGATLLGSTNADDYRNLDPFIDGSGHTLGYALIVAVDAANAGIEGDGIVDGQSPKLKANQKTYLTRPFLVRWVRCTNVTMRDVHLINPGAWTLDFFQTKGAVIDGVTIRSRDLGMQNNDGIDLDSSENVQVRNCDIVSGDDALVIKSTSSAKPSRDIHASKCRLSSRTNAIKFGTESIGGFEDISVTDCQITNTRMSEIRLHLGQQKSRRRRLHEAAARRQRRESRRNDPHRPARASRLHHHHRSLHLFLRAQENLSEGTAGADGRPASPTWKKSWARSSATPGCRCWWPFAPARAIRCPA